VSKPNKKQKQTNVDTVPGPSLVDLSTRDVPLSLPLHVSQTQPMHPQMKGFLSVFVVGQAMTLDRLCSRLLVSIPDPLHITPAIKAVMTDIEAQITYIDTFQQFFVQILKRDNQIIESQQQQLLY
jgi:hypothetical protein